MDEDRAASVVRRPRRTVLYLPGSNERAIEKAKTLPVDAIVLDLEDAVAPDAKERARENACAAVRSGNYGYREVTVRINGAGSRWHHDDLRAVAKAGPDAIVVPKVGSAEQVWSLVAAIEEARAPASTMLWAMIETPVGVLNAAQIAVASDRLTCLVMGTNDLAAELGASVGPGRAALSTALQLVLLAGRAAGATVLDGVYNDVRDLDGLRRECEQARDLGFDGKTLIHPGQVSVCHEVFTPDEAQVQNARAVIEAFAVAQAGGSAVATLNGRLIEHLHVRTAHRVIAAAETGPNPEA